jgi:site-specific recombinase XerD
MTVPVLVLDPSKSPIAIALASDHVRMTLETFFKAEVRNPNTRRAYQNGAKDFFVYLSACPHVDTLDAINALHVSGWLDAMQERGLSTPTIKQRLAGLRMLFDALVRSQVLRANPAAVVKGPTHSVTKGKTPVLSGGQTLQLLTSIDGTPAAAPGQAPTRVTLIGLRDRAMIAAMAYSFARIGAITALQMRHVFRQQGRLWLRLSEKGGKSHDVPCHHHLETYLAEWLEAAGHADKPLAPLFQTFTWGPKREPSNPEVDPSTPQHDDTSTRQRRILSGKPMTQAMTWDMLQRRARAAGIDTAICNHTFRATGITAYLIHGGTIERAAIIAGHRSTRTTQLYDRRSDDVTLDEIEKIRFV